MTISHSGLLFWATLYTDSVQSWIQAAYTYPRATESDTVFYRISRWRTRTGSSINFN